MNRLRWCITLLATVIALSMAACAPRYLNPNKWDGNPGSYYRVDVYSVSKDETREITDNETITQIVNDLLNNVWTRAHRHSDADQIRYTVQLYRGGNDPLEISIISADTICYEGYDYEYSAGSGSGHLADLDIYEKMFE